MVPALANLAKRSLRGRYLFFVLAAFLFVYVLLNYLLFYWIDPQADGAAKRVVSDDILDQIKVIKNRMNALQGSIDRSKSDADELKRLINEASRELSAQNLTADGLLPDVRQTLTPRNERLLSLLRDKTPRGSSTNSTTAGKIAVLVISCRRPSAVDNHLKQLIDNRAKSGLVDKFPIIVSQDCGHQETENAIKKYSASLFDFVKQPDLSEITQANGAAIPTHLQGYYKISRHYKWALDQVFMRHQFESVIITEEDLNIAIDFFDYFYAMNKVLVQDSDSLYCVSAWNDNGKRNLVTLDKPELVHRTDFFPGLGWMMQRSLWLEFKDKWPQGFWDDWMREEAQRKNRACIRPEISRTEISGAYGKFGVSLGQFYDNYLKFIILNTKPVNWQSMDLSNLLRRNYDTKFLDEVYESSVEISFAEYKSKVQNVKSPPEPYANQMVPLLITYSDKASFVTMAKHFGIMDDPKCGVPRTAYKGVVRIEYNYRVIYIAPSSKRSWSGYDCNWK